MTLLTKSGTLLREAVFNFCMKIENSKQNTHNTSESRKKSAVKTKITCKKYITSARQCRFAFDFQLCCTCKCRFNERPYTHVGIIIYVTVEVTVIRVESDPTGT
jgi:hypothetical protein